MRVGSRLPNLESVFCARPFEMESTATTTNTAIAIPNIVKKLRALLLKMLLKD